MIPAPPFTEIPDIRPLPELGVPDSAVLGQLYRAEHTLFSEVTSDGLVLDTGPGECALNYNDEQLAHARSGIGEQVDTIDR